MALTIVLVLILSLLGIHFMTERELVRKEQKLEWLRDRHFEMKERIEKLEEIIK